MADTEPFELKGADGKLIRGDRLDGEGRQILFVTGFLSKRWGNKSRALAQWCGERTWGFCCFDFRGNGDSEGDFKDYTLCNWLEDAWAVVRMLDQGPPLTIVGSSLGGWLAWPCCHEASQDMVFEGMNCGGIREASVYSTMAVPTPVTKSVTRTMIAV